MNILPLVLQLLALLFLLFATFGLVPAARMNWIGAGLFLWLLSLMVNGISLHGVR